MTYDMAEKYAADMFGYEYDEYSAVIRLRGNNTTFLPEIDTYGTPREGAEWAYIETVSKADTDLYGEIRYFKNMKLGWTKEEDPNE